MPALAPASIAMLQIDMRASIERDCTAAPANSITWPLPPAVPIVPIICNATSFEVTPGLSAPSTRMRMFLPLACTSVCVASTCSTSEVPMPNARAPKAPCVAVWESPHTIVEPGRVKPCSGPIMCTIPCLESSSPKYVRPKSRTFSSSVSTCVLLSASLIKDAMSVKAERSLVGTLWSTVARVQSGRRTRRLAVRRPSKAWGEVTSCTRWRSM
mmetsp:Transcript_31367/g.69168  ORF Transcript_31367/g.69168 Transcript_31367/m.69168 type:complete len:213 (+) Transcript_31367:1127-1765(+)